MAERLPNAHVTAAQGDARDGKSASAVARPIGRTRVGRYLPALDWLRRYRREWLAGDLIAGLVVAIMIVPQGMAYALLAGLPPQVGLYAAVTPLIVYGLLGTSGALAVGPVAIISLLTASGVGALAEPGSAEYVRLALTLALMVGVFQAAMGVFRLGFLVNFLSHPVLVGFSGAAAIVIGFSQVKSLLGFGVPRSDNFFVQLWYVLTHLQQTHLLTLAFGAAGLAILLFFRGPLGRLLRRIGVPDAVGLPLAKGGPLAIVLLGSLLVWGFDLQTRAGVDVVGAVPAGLPPLTWPGIDLPVWRALLTTALAITFVGYMESFSVAKTLAGKRRQKIDADQELVALGLANVGTALTGGYPVTGGFSRSLVNYEAGARTGLASIITALLVLASVLLLAPLFYYIPTAALGAIIVVAVSNLFDWRTFGRVWRYSKRDALALIATFLAVLTVGIEAGIVIGAAVSLIMFIEHTSNPHVAIVGRLNNSETYRNVKRHVVQTWPEAALVRIDATLYFGNSRVLEQTALELATSQPELRHLILIGTAVNEIDFSALEVLEALWREMADLGIQLHLADIKGPVMDRLQRSGLLALIGRDHIHMTTHDAVKALGLA